MQFVLNNGKLYVVFACFMEFYMLCNLVCGILYPVFTKMENYMHFLKKDGKLYDGVKTIWKFICSFELSFI